MKLIERANLVASIPANTNIKFDDWSVGLECAKLRKTRCSSGARISVETCVDGVTGKIDAIIDRSGAVVKSNIRVVGIDSCLRMARRTVVSADNSKV